MTAGAVKLDHEIESYNPSTGQFIAWVRVPTTSHSSNTVIYLFYGNSSVSSSQENRPGVWDANYKGVWHFPNCSTLTANDSTSNGNNGTVSGAAATPGEIGGGLCWLTYPSTAAPAPPVPPRFPILKAA